MNFRNTSHEPAKQEIVVELLHQLALRAEAVEHLQEQGTQQLLRRDRWPALMRIEFAKAMAQLLQDLANELAYLAQRMIRRNPLLRPNVREKAALILEPSAHLTLPQNHCGKSESPPLRPGELFQQTARAQQAGELEARLLLA